ncbi:ADA regulatory protein [Melissococcus plutonius DAT561]|nr:ADA regulatory protein [Melissococcus plutonius DAT561]
MIIHRKFSIFKIKCKRYSLFYTIFIPISLIGILLIGGYTCYIYQKTYHNIQKNLVNQQSNYVGQVKNNLEQKIQTIEYTFSTYSMTNQFKQMLNQPLNPHNFEEVRKIRSELAYISVMGIDNTTNYHLISLKQGWDISHNSLKQLSKNELLQKNY